MTDFLLPKVAEGALDAMQACVRAYGGVVWQIAKKSCRNREETEDLVQEVFTAIWRSAAGYDPDKGSELAFVATIARRRAIDAGRRRQRAPSLQRLEEPSELHAHDVVAPAEIDDELARVRAALDKLRPEQRQVLELCLQDGLTQTEVAERTGLALGTVKSHARRGLQRVRELLGVDAAAPSTGESR